MFVVMLHDVTSCIPSLSLAVPPLHQTKMVQTVLTQSFTLRPAA